MIRSFFLTLILTSSISATEFKYGLEMELYGDSFNSFIYHYLDIDQMSKKFRFDQVDYHELEVYADGYLNNSEAFRNLPSQIKEKLLEDLPPLEKNPLIYLDTTPKKILYREGLLKTKMPLFSGKNLKIILQEAPPISEAKELIIPSEITNQLDFQKYQNIINSKWKALGTYVWEDVLDFKYLSFKKRSC